MPLLIEDAHIHANSAFVLPATTTPRLSYYYARYAAYDHAIRQER